MKNRLVDEYADNGGVFGVEKIEIGPVPEGKSKEKVANLGIRFLWKNQFIGIDEILILIDDFKGLDDLLLRKVLFLGFVIWFFARRS